MSSSVLVRLERSLEEYTKPADAALLHLYYLYEKLPKSCKFKFLYQEMKDLIEVKGNGMYEIAEGFGYMLDAVLQIRYSQLSSNYEAEFQGFEPCRRHVENQLGV